MFTEEVRRYAEARIREGWTPEIISGLARLAGRLRAQSGDTGGADHPLSACRPHEQQKGRIGQGRDRD